MIRVPSEAEEQARHVSRQREQLVLRLSFTRRRDEVVCADEKLSAFLELESAIRSG